MGRETSCNTAQDSAFVVHCIDRGTVTYNDVLFKFCVVGALQLLRKPFA